MTATFYKIELDGTGLSGTRCERKVQRRKPLIPSNPRLGSTLVTESCGKLARWWITDEHGINGKAVYCTTCKNQILNPKPAPTTEQRLAAAVRRYNRQVERSAATARDMLADQYLRTLISTDTTPERTQP